MPALLTRMSSRPKRSPIHRAASAIDDSSVTSSGTWWNSPPSALRAATASSPRVRSREDTSTAQPCWASPRAISSPMPLFAPVTRAVFVAIRRSNDLERARSQARRFNQDGIGHGGLMTARDEDQTPAKPVLIVDGANVVGSRADGWWRDRAGAAARLRDRLATLGGVEGLPGAGPGISHP